MRVNSIWLAIATTLTFSSAALADKSTAPGQNKLLCFDGTSDGGFGGACTVTSGAKSKQVGTLTTNGGHPNGEYAGVYFEKGPLDGKYLGQMANLAFSYAGSPAGAGAPRFSVPIDFDNNGTWDLFAFISAFYCNDGAGRVDVINDATCTIFIGSESFPNWAAFAAAHPTWRIAKDAVTFIISDEPGQWTISNVKY